MAEYFYYDCPHCDDPKCAYPMADCAKMMDDEANEIVSLYPCLSCGKHVIVQKGNHHPWCLHCMYDQFDWAAGHEDITREKAEKLQEELDR